LTHNNEYFLLDGFSITRLLADSHLENDCSALLAQFQIHVFEIWRERDEGKNRGRIDYTTYKLKECKTTWERNEAKGTKRMLAQELQEDKRE